MTRILFIPDMEGVRTAERTPLLYRTLKAEHDVVGLSAPLDRLVYDADRAKLPRYFLYLIDKVLMAFRGLFLARSHRADLVVCSTSHHALPGLAIARILGLRCLWDSQGNVKLFSESLGKGWFFTRGNVLLERLIGKAVDTLITVSDRDADAYVDMGIPRSKIHVIPISVVLSDIDAKLAGESRIIRGIQSSSDSPILLFFGSFKYVPNLEALEFINESLAPYLEENGIRCEILIAGRDIPDMPYHPYLKPLGFIHEIHRLLWSSDLCLVPIWKGVGILTKVLDAMGVGTPLVLTEFVAHLVPGIRDGVHAFVASSEETFPELVLEALSSPDACKSMAARARQLVEESYNWASYTALLDAIVRGGTQQAGGSLKA